MSNDFEEEDVSEEDGEEYNACIENTMHHFRIKKKLNHKLKTRHFFIEEQNNMVLITL